MLAESMLEIPASVIIACIAALSGAIGFVYRRLKNLTEKYAKECTQDREQLRCEVKTLQNKVDFAEKVPCAHPECYRKLVFDPAVAMASPVQLPPATAPAPVMPVVPPSGNPPVIIRRAPGS